MAGRRRTLWKEALLSSTGTAESVDPLTPAGGMAGGQRHLRNVEKRVLESPHFPDCPGLRFVVRGKSWCYNPQLLNHPVPSVSSTPIGSRRVRLGSHSAGPRLVFLEPAATGCRERGVVPEKRLACVAAPLRFAVSVPSSWWRLQPLDRLPRRTSTRSQAAVAAQRTALIIGACASQRREGGSESAGGAADPEHKASAEDKARDGEPEHDRCGARAPSGSGSSPQSTPAVQRRRLLVFAHQRQPATRAVPGG